ncbi:hypothetical protein B7C51_25010 (plasmid) [Paenibacillus larvae subsp. pulvifaciens]|uniref:GmrSD restriction endonucleases N-terminal domain-containing protein n=1 Tax=Paenibacillus larvae subsp. pulvifaciens TaxID=1477 RepID=A0A1V0UZT3_9BACL|nr:DUF262 domain-containing protein [Paenibacillus larvae]ARF70735.1 hypothetical protein B7C51_25010 [Paenibacillus larvae subsp. pulvifaciens]
MSKELSVVKKTKSDKSINWFVRNRKRIRFDLEVQRNQVWSEDQKSLLVHSALIDFPIPDIYVKSTDDKYLWVIDGQQRLSTLMAFRQGEFPVTKSPKVPVEKEIDGETKIIEIDIEGKYYQDLDKELRDIFGEYSLTLVEMKNMTEEQVDDLFSRLNNGTALNKIEKLRSEVGGSVMKHVNEIANSDFFRKYVNISANSRKRKLDTELVIQSIMLVSGREGGLQGKDVKEFSLAFKETGFHQTILDEMIKLTNYMKEAFEQFDQKTNNKMLKKVHTPILFVTAKKAIEKEVSPIAFGLWAKEFLVRKYTSGQGSYGMHCTAGSAKSQNVLGRVAAMNAHFEENIEEFEKAAQRIKAVSEDGIQEIAAANEHQEALTEELDTKDTNE